MLVQLKSCVCTSKKGDKNPGTSPKKGLPCMYSISQSILGHKNHRDTLMETACRLCYIYGLCTKYIHGANLLPVAPLVLKFGIHLGEAGRKGVRGGEEEGWSGRVESCSS
jgi:hypothetical protein